MTRPRIGNMAAAACLGLAALGCGGPAMNPPTDQARKALETALEAWKSGKKPVDLASIEPPMQVADVEWTNGRKLASFEILREEPSQEDKRFTAHLTYVNPPGSGDVLYIVLGSRPLAVFREEDYARTLNMDNNPPAKKPRR